VEHPGTDPDTVKAPAECGDVEHADGRRVATLNAVAFAALQGRIEARGTQASAIRFASARVAARGSGVSAVNGLTIPPPECGSPGRTAGRRCQPSSSSEKSSSSAGRLVLVVLAAILG